MSNQSQCKSKKPLAYLDQNVLIFLTNHRPKVLIEIFRDCYQVIYSEANLDEIRRSEMNVKSLLKTLELLKAKFFTLGYDPALGPVGSISTEEVFDVFKNFCRLAMKGNETTEALRQICFKLLGGKSGAAIREILESQGHAIAELVKSTAKENNEIFGGIYGDSTVKNKVETEFNNHSHQLIEELHRYAKVKDDFSPIVDFRKTTKLNPKKLNNIKPPKVLHQIWEEHCLSQPHQRDKSIDEFYGISPKQNLIAPGITPTIQEKIATIYSQLNIRGYWPDNSLEVESNFTRSTSDQYHATYAWAANFLFSFDNKFINKTAAIYEFLNIRTSIFRMHIKNNQLLAERI